MDSSETDDQAGIPFSQLKTRSSLIQGLQEGDELAWSKFYELYHPMLLNWARRRGLSTADADDFVGLLLHKLVIHLARFQYDREQTFRGYMRRILDNATRDEHKKRGRFERVFATDEGDQIQSKDATESILDELCEQESRVLKIQAQQEVLSGLDERERSLRIAMATKVAPIPEIAAEFGISKPTLYRIKDRIDQQIRKRYEELSGGST